jgi:hypothetical protein
MWRLWRARISDLGSVPVVRMCNMALYCVTGDDASGENFFYCFFSYITPLTIQI